MVLLPGRATTRNTTTVQVEYTDARSKPCILVAKITRNRKLRSPFLRLIFVDGWKHTKRFEKELHLQVL
jgi:hypothetical protein